MPTLIQRAKARMDLGTANTNNNTNAKGEHLVNPQKASVEIGPSAAAFETAGKGQVLGGQNVKKSTLPDSKADNLENVDKTPPAYAKVLPWILEIPAEGYEPPGMFGPYDSQPPTRPETIHEATIPPPVSRSIHPFAYGHPATLPFSAFAAGEQGALEQEANHRARTRESEMLSRGAGMRGLGGDEMEGSGSLGMGTFGMEPTLDTGYVNMRQAPTQRTESPYKPSTPRRKPPIEPYPPNPPSKSPMTPKSNRVPPPRDSPTRTPAGSEKSAAQEVPQLPPQPHVHHPHHDFPFSHEAAAAKQAKAMEAARADALAQLEAARKSITQQAINPTPNGGGKKGPRGTYETSTSGLSFGHIMHKDGRPTRISIPGPVMMDAHAGQEHSPMSMMLGQGLTGSGPGDGPGGSFRIPFGVPMSASIPRPMLVMRNSAGVGLGLGMGMGMNMGMGMGSGGLPDVAESPQSRGRQTARSAYVETIEDEQEPCRTVKTPTRREPSAGPSLDGTVRPAAEAARTESGIQPLRSASKAPTAVGDRTADASPGYKSAQPYDERETFPRNRPQGQTHASGLDGGDAIYPPDRQKTARTARTARSVATHSHQHSQVKSHQATASLMQLPVAGQAPPSPPPSPPASEAPSHMPSMAPTSASNVKQLVADSRFHDETLCQLLDAARLKLIGGEAKKALQRAARARVIELKDLKAKGEMETPGSPLKRDKRDKLVKSRETSRSRRKSDVTVKGTPDQVQPTTPPEWAQTIIARLEAFDQRFSELEKLNVAQAGAGNDEYVEQPTQDMVGQLIDDLLYHDFMPPGLPPGLMDMGHSFPFHQQVFAQQSQHSAIHPVDESSHVAIEEGMTAAPSREPSIAQQQARSRGRGSQPPPRDSITWGSEVELPQPNETVSPPRAPPTINIQAPTESGVGRSSHRVPSGPTVSHATPRTAPGMPKRDIVFEAPGGVIHNEATPSGMDRELPPAPSESVKSNRPTPTARGVPLPEGAGTQYSTPGDASARLVSPPTNEAHSAADPRRTQASSMYKTAPVAGTQYLPTNQHSPVPMHRLDPTHLQGGHTPEQNTRDVIHVTDSNAEETFPDPWDLITQKLYSWGMVWDDETFVRAMERISLGEQVEDCPLTVFMTMTYKRLIRNNLCSIPQKACDKLFIPPTIASAINAAIHGKQVDNAAQILHEMWESYRLSATPPRVIIALARHRNETDLWTAHRFDLHSHQMTSYGISHDDSITRLKDGRPFMWWYAIRLAWPECKIPDPVDAGLQVRFETIKTSPESRKDNSLVAANTARNLLCGYRPERTTDYTKMRELIWAEVKRLLHKKRTGRLIIDYDSADHVYEV